MTFLPFPKNFLIATTSAMMPIMMNFFAAKRATHRPLKNPSLAAMPPATSAAIPASLDDGRLAAIFSSQKQARTALQVFSGH